MIITDADAAMTCAVSAILPGTTYLHCLWHIMENIRKLCEGALKGGAGILVRLVKTAAFATSENVSSLLVLEVSYRVGGA